jgi:hypothetical protein
MAVATGAFDGNGSIQWGLKTVAIDYGDSIEQQHGGGEMQTQQSNRGDNGSRGQHWKSTRLQWEMPFDNFRNPASADCNHQISTLMVTKTIFTA